MLNKKTFLLSVSVIYTVGLTGVCLMKLNKMPDVGVSFGDKIFHLLAYLLLTFLWVNTFFLLVKTKKDIVLPYIALFCVVFGIVIEVLQGTITAYRSADVFDVVANTAGVLLAVLILSVQKIVHIKK
ncbi:MAG: VanZ family protein [Confluentibacter sp.]|nr:VanZ family protein [Confluentibacter sp.]